MVGLAGASHHPLLPPFPSASLRRALHSHAPVQGGRDKGCVCFMTHWRALHHSSAAEQTRRRSSRILVPAWAPPLLCKPSWRACPYRQEQGARASPGVLTEGSHPGGTAAARAVPREGSLSHRPAHTPTCCAPRCTKR